MDLSSEGNYGEAHAAGGGSLMPSSTLKMSEDAALKLSRSVASDIREQHKQGLRARVETREERAARRGRLRKSSELRTKLEQDANSSVPLIAALVDTSEGEYFISNRDPRSRRGRRTRRGEELRRCFGQISHNHDDSDHDADAASEGQAMLTFSAAEAPGLLEAIRVGELYVRREGEHVRAVNVSNDDDGWLKLRLIPPKARKLTLSSKRPKDDDINEVAEDFKKQSRKEERQRNKKDAKRLAKRAKAKALMRKQRKMQRERLAKQLQQRESQSQEFDSAVPDDLHLYRAEDQAEAPSNAIAQHHVDSGSAPDGELQRDEGCSTAQVHQEVDDQGEVLQIQNLDIDAADTDIGAAENVQKKEKKKKKKKKQKKKKKKFQFQWDSAPGWEEPKIMFSKVGNAPKIQWKERWSAMERPRSAPTKADSFTGGLGLGKLQYVSPVLQRRQRLGLIGTPPRAGSRAMPSSYSPIDAQKGYADVVKERRRTLQVPQEESVANVQTNPAAIERERLRVLEAQEELYSGQMKSELLSRGIAELCPDDGVLHDRQLWWKSTIVGPNESPYATARFNLRIILDDYPTRPPRIFFLTPIYHPAIRYGANREMKIHWADGPAAWTRRFMLSAVVEVVLQLLRFPETHSLVGGVASDLWEDDKVQFAREAARLARRDADAEFISNIVIERYDERMSVLMKYANPNPRGRLNGAFVHSSSYLTPRRFGERRQMVAGHRMIAAPSFHNDASDADESDLGAPKRRLMWMNADAKEVRPDTAPQPDRTFNSEGLWEPGQKLKFGGLLNAEPLERVQRADRSILMKPSAPLELVGSYNLMDWDSSSTSGSDDTDSYDSEYSSSGSSYDEGWSTGPSDTDDAAHLSDAGMEAEHSDAKEDEKSYAEKREAAALSYLLRAGKMGTSEMGDFTERLRAEPHSSPPPITATRVM
eukprot:g3216.t1